MPGTQLAFSRCFHWVRRGSSCRRGSQLQSLRITKGSFSRYRHQRSLDKKWGLSIFSATPSDTDGVGPRKPWRNSALMMAMGRGSVSLAQLKTQEQFVRHTPEELETALFQLKAFPFTLCLTFVQFSEHLPRHRATGIWWGHLITIGFPRCSGSKAPAYNAGDLGSIPGSRRSPGEGNGNPLQYSCLENPMDGGAWWATAHGVTKSRTQLSDFTFTFFHFLITINMQHLPFWKNEDFPHPFSKLFFSFTLNVVFLKRASKCCPKGIKVGINTPFTQTQSLEILLHHNEMKWKSFLGLFEQSRQPFRYALQLLQDARNGPRFQTIAGWYPKMLFVVLDAFEHHPRLKRIQNYA